MNPRTWAEAAIASTSVLLAAVVFNLASIGGPSIAAEFVQPYDLAIFKTAPPSVLAGNDLTYGITVTNMGGNTSHITVTDLLPLGTTFQSLTTTDFTCTTPPVGSGGTITCTRNSMADPDSRMLQVAVNVDAATPKDTVIPNTAEVKPTICFWPLCDRDSSNDSSSANTTVDTEADLVFLKTSPVDEVLAGMPVSYTLTVTNNGPSAAQDVMIVDTTPPNTTFVSAVPSSGSCVTPPPDGTGMITCTYPGATPPGASHSVVITIKTCAGGTDTCDAQVINTAQASSSTSDPTPANSTATVATGLQRLVPVLGGIGMGIEILLLLVLGGWALGRLRVARRPGAD